MHHRNMRWHWALEYVYPLPNNGANALQLIFPNATDELSQRHGLRKAFKRSDTYCLVAQCKIQYMEEGF